MTNRWPNGCWKHPPGLNMRKLRFPMIADQNTAVAVCPQSPAAPFSIAQAIEQHLPTVQKIAGIAYHKFGRTFEQDDLVGYGHLGLVLAVRKYAALKHDLRQAVDFADFAKKRIWRSIETGRDQMATVGRDQYRAIKRGEMAKPRFCHESEKYTFANVLSIGEVSSRETDTAQIKVDELVAWLQKQAPLGAKVVDLHCKRGKTMAQIGAEIGKSEEAVGGLYHRALNLLRGKCNPNTSKPVRDRSASNRACYLRRKASGRSI